MARSEELSNNEAADRITELAEQLVRSHEPFLSYIWRRHLVAVAHAGDWPDEAGALLVDADLAWVHALAFRLGQSAYVRAAIGEAPRLEWLE